MRVAREVSEEGSSSTAAQIGFVSERLRYYNAGGRRAE